METEDLPFETIILKVERNEDEEDNNSEDEELIESHAMDLEKVKTEPEINSTIPDENILVMPEFIKVEVEDVDYSDIPAETESDALALELFKCDLCGKELITKATLIQHMRLHTEEKKPRPSDSSSGFNSSVSLKQPLIQKRGKPYACTICPSKFRMKRTLDAHILSHTGEKPFACEICPSKFREQRLLNSHMQVHVERKSFTCSLCPRKFKHESHLKHHTLTHSRSETFYCKFCPMKFCTKASFHRHLKTHVGEKIITCQFCPLKFRGNGDLTDHMRTHTEDKKYSAKFGNKSNSEDHFKLGGKNPPAFSGDSPETPEEGFKIIGKFPTCSSFQKRVEIFRCEFCSKTYVAKNNYTRHLKVHAAK